MTDEHTHVPAGGRGATTRLAWTLVLAYAAAEVVGGWLSGSLALVADAGHGHGSLNMRGAWLHVLTDTLGSVQAIGAALLIYAWGWNWVDPVASLLIAALVVYSAWSLLAQSVTVLMESAPSQIDVGTPCHGTARHAPHA